MTQRVSVVTQTGKIMSPTVTAVIHAVISAVTIIVVTIFIAIFQHYRIISLLR